MTNPDIPAKPIPVLFVIGILSFIACVGGFVAWDAAEDYRKQVYASEHFVPVQATVLESEVKTRRSHNSNKTSWHPAIRYRYEVDGKGYKSRRYSYTTLFNNTREFAEKVVAEHPVGATVTAYYDPERPKRAVLDNTLPDTTLIMTFFALFFGVFLFIGGIVVRQLLAQRREAQRF
ncbi:MAG: DUF3592 domain-containing protein [Alphaproteobacteria bacterium]|nr:DUF3592 domain-containing protein [Alphaproteobacteria bacterium]MCD8520484.1 DUF3592 domain-containing protein [Alphaproteobacteria bacterium]MCD8571180.1 DUF3592 domain-containing protein [Alphaproteobacteria bacterium]